MPPELASLSIPALLERAAGLWGARTFVVSRTGEPVASFSDVARQATTLAAWLREEGVSAGDRIAFLLERSHRELVAVAGCTHGGGVCVSVPTRATETQVGHILADSDPTLVIADSSRLAAARAASKKARVVSWLDIPWTAMPAATPARATPDDLATLSYTSGSTGLPKGVMVTHRNLLTAVQRITAYLSSRESDRVLAYLPINAPWGLLQWLNVLYAGGEVALPPPTAFADELARTVRDTRVRGLAALPVTWIQLVDWLQQNGQSLDDLRYVTSSGGMLPPRVLDAMPRVFPQAEIFLTYGLTEAFRTTLVPPSFFAAKKGSLGRPCHGVNITVGDEHGHPVQRGQPGELIHHGDCVTLGYWRNPEATALVYARTADGLRSHRSGDIVREDEDGFLWLIGRKDSLIKAGGYRISSEEIEAAAQKNPLVRHAVAWGEPDEILGHIVMLAIQVSANVTEVDVRRELRRHLPSYAWPRRIIIWNEPMPRTGNGKIDRQSIAGRDRVSD